MGAGKRHGGYQQPRKIERWRYVELDGGLIRIERRLCHGGIGEPKTDRSRRVLTSGYLADRYLAKAKAEGAKPEGWVFKRTDSLDFPIWDSTVRELLHNAANGGLVRKRID